MAYDVRLIKIVTGELVIGKYDAQAKALTEVAIIQTVPGQQGVQMLLLPYGYPFENSFSGKIEEVHFLYQYSNIGEDIQTKYLEACSNISLSSGGLNPKPASGSGLIL